MLDRLLFKSVSKQRLLLSRLLLSLGANPDTGSEKFSALHVASALGNSSIVRLLILSGAKFSVDITGCTALHRAVWYDNNTDIVSALLDQNHSLPINIPSASGLTALHLACLRSHNDFISMLMSTSSIDPMTEDKQTRIPLHYAALKCDESALKAFSSSASFRTMLQRVDANNFSALHFAALGLNVSALRHLLSFRDWLDFDIASTKDIEYNGVCVVKGSKVGDIISVFARDGIVSGPLLQELRGLLEGSSTAIPIDVAQVELDDTSVELGALPRMSHLAAGYESGVLALH